LNSFFIVHFIAIFENLLEFRPDLCIDAGKQGLMQWLLRRIKTKVPFDANKLYASELLSILLQHTPENRLLLGDLDGIDVLLQQLAVCICIIYFYILYFFIYKI
jgi:beta-catenin-like protein 1